MTGNETGGSSDADTDDGDGVEVARLVAQYLDSAASVGDDALRECLQREIDGRIVDVDPGGIGITVIVERDPEDGDRFREHYSVQPVTDIDGILSLDWTYLGSVT